MPRPKLIALTTVLLACTGAAQSAVTAFDSHPTTNSADWSERIVSLNGTIDTRIDFETHPLGSLLPDFYAAAGVHMSLAGSSFSFDAVYDYRNNYGGTVYGYGPNSPGEGIAAESRAYSAYNPNGSWTLTLNFDQAVLGAGLFVIDLFNGMGNRTVTLAAYDGANASGNLLATAAAPSFNFQLYNKLFLGVAATTSTPTIRSIVLTNPYPYYGDGIAIDDVRFATAAVPEPGTGAMLLAGAGLLGAIGRRRRA